jgi:hypothetical protein
MVIMNCRSIPLLKWSFEMKEKKIDCVKMKHQAAEQIYTKQAKLSPDKKRNFWNDHYKKMLVRNRRKKSSFS